MDNLVIFTLEFADSNNKLNEVFVDLSLKLLLSTISLQLLSKW